METNHYRYNFNVNSPLRAFPSLIRAFKGKLGLTIREFRDLLFSNLAYTFSILMLPDLMEVSEIRFGLVLRRIFVRQF